jgi:hypothetical protein
MTKLIENPSETLINQRIRNRIIEALEIYLSIEFQERFGLDEVINIWEDWVDNERMPEYTEPVFTKQEQFAITNFHKQWEKVCKNTPQIMPSVKAMIEDKNWIQLINIAEETLKILLLRGRLSEEVEIK